MSDAYSIAKRWKKSILFLDLNIHPVTKAEVHDYIAEVVKNQQKALVLNVNIHCINLAIKHTWLRHFLNQAQIVFCDGDGVRWGLKCVGQSAPEKITYNEWIWQLAAYCEKNHLSFYFLGARPGVAEYAAEQLRGRYPSLDIMGVHDGYFLDSPKEQEKVVAEVNRLRPDILVLGLGMPKQEKWLSENWRRLNAHIFLTGGAVFDYASGKLAIAPQWMIHFHLEWLYRLCQEPRRLGMRYAWGIPSFFYHVILGLIMRRCRKENQ